MKPPARGGCERVDTFQVPGSDRFSRLHLDRDAATATILEHDVHLTTGVRSKMVDAGPCMTPTDLLHNLTGDERLEKWAQSLRALHQCFHVSVHKV